MTIPELVASMVLMAGPQHPNVQKYVEYRARVLAPVILAEHAEFDPIIIAAQAWKESSFRLNVEGSHGDVGPWQVRREGLARYLCRDLLPDLKDRTINLRCAVRLLRRAISACGPDPAHFLGKYNGKTECGPGKYSKRVLAIAARARLQKS